MADRFVFDFGISVPHNSGPCINYLAIDRLDGKKFKQIKVGGKRVSPKVKFFTDFLDQDTFDLEGSEPSRKRRSTVLFEGVEVPISGDEEEDEDEDEEEDEDNEENEENDDEDDMYVD